jgi:hypothetical protein
LEVGEIGEGLKMNLLMDDGMNFGIDDAVF